jgi:nucleotide-binding universal stress UspA family protein
MATHNHLLVGLRGQDSDEPLIRYASMVARVNAVPGFTAFPVSAIRERSTLSRPRDNLWRLPDFPPNCNSDLLLVEHVSSQPHQRVRLVFDAPGSVWFVPPGSVPVLRRVLVPIDFSDRSAASLQSAIELARSFPIGKCLALHVYRTDSRFEHAETDRRRRSKLMDDFGAIVEGCHTHGVEIEPLFVSSHRMGQAIAQAAAQYRTDLVVMSTRGRTRYSRLLLPSGVEAAIREYRGSLLVLKSTGTSLTLLQALRERWRKSESVQFS